MIIYQIQLLISDGTQTNSLNLAHRIPSSSIITYKRTIERLKMKLNFIARPMQVFLRTIHWVNHKTYPQKQSLGTQMVSNRCFIFKLLKFTANMDSPKKEPTITDNLYQIPTCTICLQELSQDLCNLACGHCFHFICITQHFEYRGTCPNCQKRACLKQARTVHFPVTINTKTSAQMRALMSILSVSEKQQMEQLLKQLKTQSQKAEKLQNQNIQVEHQLKARTFQLQNQKQELTRKKNEIESLRTENKQLGLERDSLRMNLNESQSSEAFLRAKLDKLELQLKDYEQFKRYKKIMNENSQELLRLKAEMEYKQVPAAEMAKQFFEICQMGKLQEGKNRQKLKDMQQKLKYYDQEISKLKEVNARMEKQLTKINEKLNLQRKKSEEHEIKYKRLKEKSVQASEKQDSNPFSNASKKMFKAQTAKVSKPSIQVSFVEKIQSIAENSNKKPTFSSTNKFGGLGFRKKDDRINFFK